MRITFLGGADEVGASSLLIEIGGKRLLIDAGIRPSPKARWGLRGDQLPHLDAVDSPDAILVTHAHTDHTGALELVVGRYPHCPVYATPPTIALTRVLHADARRIMQSRLDEEGELPLFDDVAVEKLLTALTPIEFHARLPLGKNLRATFYPAGHIAGAAMILLDSDEGRVLISGDVSFTPQRTVDGCKPPTLRPDVLILESTYGGRLHAHRATEERKLVERIAAITNAGGKVLIPAFALGRAQELIEILRAFRKAGELLNVPVWVDGMVRVVCSIYSQFPETLPLALQERGAKFFDETTRAIESVAQRNALIWENNPGIIIASSGMLAGGPSLSYARALAGKPEHAILLTGYQDEESPGRKLQAMATRGRGTLKLGNAEGRVVDVQCQLGTYALSAHADEGQLIALTETLDPTTVFIVHGDADARASLQKALRERRRRVELPRAGQSFDVNGREKRPSQSPNPVRSGDPKRPLDLKLLWREIADPGGNYFTFAELARAWWGDESRTDEMRAALEHDNTHFVLVERDLVRAQVERKNLPGLGDLEGLPPPAMEPNQALAFAREQFLPEARLRRAGYRLDTHTLALTFDFPDAARERLSDIFARIENATQWKIELDAEANQSALAMLARELLPLDFAILKGPSIYREEKRIALTVSGAGDLVSACEQFRATSGYTLSVTLADVGAANNLAVAPTTGALEINAALGLIRAQLAGSTLYRTSLKGSEIVLSFISPQVGGRYRAKMDELTQAVGWTLSINPQPNQNAILQVAEELIARASGVMTRRPSIHIDRGEVRVAIVDPSQVDDSMRAEFESRTGYRFVVETSAVQAAPVPTATREEIVEIPLALIRLTRHQQTLALDPDKQRKTAEQLQRLGRANKPIRVQRRVTDYLLLDGLYRLRAAQALGWERIAAVVEERT